jgi:hypothetical protein
MHRLANATFTFGGINVDILLLVKALDRYPT